MQQFSFEKLEVWQDSRALVKQIYHIAASFPNDEKYGLISQIKRSSISVSSNIAEGTTRRGARDKARFIEFSFGSLMELLNQLILDHDLSYLTEEDLSTLRTKINKIANKLSALRRSILTPNP